MGDRFEVRAVCAEVAQRAEQVAREFKAEAVDGFRALAARQDVDAVLMFAAGWFGPLPILAACDAGKAVYCAASLNVDLPRAQEIKRRVEQSGVAFMFEFPRRHAPATLRLKELIATRLGQPQLLFCHWRLPGAVRNTTRNGSHGGEVLRSLLDLVDWCRYVVGSEPGSVWGVTTCGVGAGRRMRLPDDEPGLFAADVARHRSSRSNQLRRLHAGELAGSHYVSSTRRAPGLLRKGNRLH